MYPSSAVDEVPNWNPVTSPTNWKHIVTKALLKTVSMLYPGKKAIHLYGCP